MDTDEAFRWTREVAISVLEEIEYELKLFEDIPFRFAQSLTDAAYMEGCYETDHVWRCELQSRFAKWRKRLWAEIAESDERIATSAEG